MPTPIDKADALGSGKRVPEDLRWPIDPKTFAYGGFGIPEEVLSAPLDDEDKLAILRDWERQLKLLGTTKSVLFSLEVRTAIAELS